MPKCDETGCPEEPDYVCQRCRAQLCHEHAADHDHDELVTI